VPAAGAVVWRAGRRRWGVWVWPAFRQSGRGPLDQPRSGAARRPSRSSPSGPGAARRAAIVLTVPGSGSYPNSACSSSRLRAGCLSVLVVVGLAGEHGRAKRARAQPAAAEGRLDVVENPVTGTTGDRLSCRGRCFAHESQVMLDTGRVADEPARGSRGARHDPDQRPSAQRLRHARVVRPMRLSRRRDECRSMARDRHRRHHRDGGHQRRDPAPREPQAHRVEVSCPRRCAVRVAGSVTTFEGTYDSSPKLRAGTTVPVPYESAAEPITPLRRARTAELGIAVDDATGRAAHRRDGIDPALSTFAYLCSAPVSRGWWSPCVSWRLLACSSVGAG